MLQKLFSRGMGGQAVAATSTSANSFQSPGGAAVSVSAGALVDVAPPAILRRVSTRENCSPAELAEIDEICKLLGVKVESKVKPIALMWHVACEDNATKYKGNFMAFLQDFKVNLSKFLGDARNESDVRTSLSAKISLPPLAIKRVYILCFKTDNLRGKPEEGRLTSEELMQKSEAQHGNLDDLMNSGQSR